MKNVTGIIGVNPIVPVIPSATVTPSIPPKLVYQGGMLLSNVQVVLLFWGNAWLQTQQKLISQYLYLFFENVVTSPLIDQLKEYSVPQYSIGHGSVSKSVTIPHQNISPIVADLYIQNVIHQQIASGNVPAPTANTLYFFFVPSGVKVENGIEFSCFNFCGYHGNIGTSLFYAVIPYPDCHTCLGNFSVNDALTIIASHELCEAITDPIPGTGWVNVSSRNEIGDLCSWQTKDLPNTNYTVQREWSNNANGCV